jgi:hypothetical protein
LFGVLGVWFLYLAYLVYFGILGLLFGVFGFWFGVFGFWFGVFDFLLAYLVYWLA